MRVLAIGDIHGCFQALVALADAARITPDDLIVMLGGYWRPRPELYAPRPAIANSKTNTLVALRGNHELMMLRAQADPSQMKEWLANGGDATLASYSPLGDAGTLRDVPDGHWDFLEKGCRDWYETQTHSSFTRTPTQTWPWTSSRSSCSSGSNSTTPRRINPEKSWCVGIRLRNQGVPKSLGHAVCIDTWACGQGWLTCLDVATGQYWQANQRGERDRTSLATATASLIVMRSRQRRDRDVRWR